MPLVSHCIVRMLIYTFVPMAWATRQHITLGVAKVVRGTGASGNITAWLVKLLCRGYTVPATASDTGTHPFTPRAFFLPLNQGSINSMADRVFGYSR